MPNNQLQISGASRQRLGLLSGVAKTMALPHETQPMRLPTYPNLERTALVNVEFNTTSNSKVFDRPSRRFMLCRDAGAPFWFDDKFNQTSAVVPQLAYVSGVSVVRTENPRPYEAANWNHASGLSPFGLDHEDNLWAWAPADVDGNPFMQFWAVTDNGSVDIQIEILNPSGNVTTKTLIGVGRTEPKPLGVGNVWVRLLSIKNIGAETTRVGLSFTGEHRFLMPAFRPLESSVSTAPYDSCRCNAVSLLMTNVSRVQIKQGTILAARLQRSDLKPWSFTEDDLSVAHPAERYFGAAEVGLYTFVAPGESTSRFRQAGFNNQPVTHWKPGQVLSTLPGEELIDTDNFHYSPTVHVYDDEYFHAIVVSEEQGVDETLLALTVDMHVEFRSTSSLFQIGISALPLETYHAALLALSQSGYFFENATHWKQLAALLVRGINAALPIVAPQIAAPVRTLATAAYTGYKAGKAIVASMKKKPRNMTQKQMVAPSKPASRPRRGRAQRRRR